MERYRNEVQRTEKRNKGTKEVLVKDKESAPEIWIVIDVLISKMKNQTTLFLEETFQQ